MAKKATSGDEQPVGKCFVMMPFRMPFDRYYEVVFKPAIADANLFPERADDLFRPGVIVSDMWQMIQDATVLLAELTTKNANVFYELGLAHAIGKPIVMVAETMDDVPFDLRNLRVLIYDKDEPDWGARLATSITTAINEALDNPVEAVPTTFRKIVESQAPEQDAVSARLDEVEAELRSLKTGVPGVAESTRNRLLAQKSLINSLIQVREPHNFADWVEAGRQLGFSDDHIESLVEAYASNEIKDFAKGFGWSHRSGGRTYHN